MFDQFRGKMPIPEPLWDKFVSRYHRLEVPARTVLLREGQVSKKAYLIEKGCLRIWFNHDGKDISFQFFFENEGVSSAESFRRSVPSLFTIETIEPCILHWIDKEDLDANLRESMEVPAMREQMLEVFFERQLHYMKHFLSFIRDSPAERYRVLVREKPHIIQRVPQQHIASYLGITPVSLSRIRNRIS